MSDNAALGELRYGQGNLSYVIVFFISVSLHMIVVTGIMFILSQRHIEKRKFPQIIELVSFPIAQRQLPSFPAPQRVAKLPANRQSSSPEAMPQTQPQQQIEAAPSETPVQSPTLVSEKPAQPYVQSATAKNGQQGEKENGDDVIDVGSIKTLDNVNYTPLYNPKPAYPPIAIRAGIQGSVDVDLVINEFGRVEQFFIVKVEGHPDFGNETAKIIGKWRFPPPRINGKRVKIKYLYTVNFRLQ